MPSEYLDVTFGVLDDPIVRFRNRFGTGAGNRGAFLSPRDPQNILLLQATIEEIAYRLEEALKDEFEHHSVTGETIDTFHVEGHGLVLKVVMEGGAIYVEYGSAPHVIAPKEGGRLWWDEMQHPLPIGYEVMHPGYAGDDFVGRAMHRVELQATLQKLAHGVITDVVGYAENNDGVQYTQGQFLQ